jgi:guanylate kinase
MENYAEFKEVLAKYQISDRAKSVLKDLSLVLMLGPTSSGRNTIIRRQIETGHYYYIVSDTTRPPRVNDGVLEQNGKEYWFRTEAEVLADLKAGEYLEAEYTTNRYLALALENSKRLSINKKRLLQMLT